MKKGDFRIYLLLSFQAIFAYPCIAVALDAVTNIELRNSSEKFEKCMGEYHNDITECLDDFWAVLDINKKVAEKYPQSEEVKTKILTLVNALNDIAETYFSSAESKKDLDPFLSAKYSQKAALCYEQLSKLYQHNEEFNEKTEKAKQMAKYAEIRVLLLEIKDRKNVGDAILTLDKLLFSYNTFKKQYGNKTDIYNSIVEYISLTESSFQKLFSNTINFHDKNNIPTLIYILQAEDKIISISPEIKFIENYKKMELSIIKIISEIVADYYSELNSADQYFNKKNYYDAKLKYEELMSKIYSHPDCTTATKSLQDRIAIATNNFNIVEFESATSLKLKIATEKNEIATNTAEYLSNLEQGKKAYEKKEWINAYKQLVALVTFSETHKMDMNEDSAKQLLQNTRKQIRELDPNEIKDDELVKLHFEPISYQEWLGMARNGDFSEQNVSISGQFQQKINDTIILKETTINYDFNFQVAYTGERMNNAAIIIPGKQRLFTDGAHISCIGKFKKTETFNTVLNKAIELPVFLALWCHE